MEVEHVVCSKLFSFSALGLLMNRAMWDSHTCSSPGCQVWAGLPSKSLPHVVLVSHMLLPSTSVHFCNDTRCLIIPAVVLYNSLPKDLYDNIC